MSASQSPFGRRKFLATSAASLAAIGWGVSAMSAQPDKTASDSPQPAPKKRLRVAAINSIFRLRSHAYHILGRFVHGYRKDGFHHQPPFDVVRMFDDQAPKDDMGPAFCKQHNIELCQSVPQALGGEKGLDVDAVLLIIEHGDYPTNELGQVLYPRYAKFQEIVEVFRQSGRSVPIFVDKQLSYDHRHAAEMVAMAKKVRFGLMAGSSLPVTWRLPELEPPLETPFTEGLVCYGFDRGSQDIYLIHALETLQCMLERRKGGETGVKSVVCLQGDAVWKAGDDGRWSWKLLEAALARCPTHNVGPIRENVLQPIAILVEYADGTRGAVINVMEQVADFGFAAHIQGQVEPVSTCFFLPRPPGARFFDPLTYNIEQFFQSGKPTYPVERTLLTSTMLDLGLHSLKDGSKPVGGAALEIKYQAPASSGFFRGPFVDNP